MPSDDTLRSRRPLSPSKVWAVSLFLLKAVLPYAVCLLIGFLFGLNQVIAQLPADGDGAVSFGGQPALQTLERTFVLNETFIGPASPESDRAWADLLPPGRGFVGFDSATLQPIHHNVLKPKPSFQNTRTVSVFHQLHCLNELRIGYYAGQSGTADAAADDAHHCFDYLRQALMCGADSTLETLKPASEHDGHPRVDGWGVTHRCRSFDDLWLWTARYRKSDATGIV